MLMSLALAALTLRAGLSMRRLRRAGARRPPELRRRHLRLARPAVVLLMLGFVGGPASALWLRDWQPFGTFHAWIGLLAATLFGAAALLGHRLERGRSQSRDLHALLGTLALLAGALTAVAGFVLLP